MNYTKIPETTFQELQLNAGILCTTFAPTTGVASGLIGATTGGIKFTATPTFKDMGDDVDNCPKNTKELKKVESTEVKLAGTFVTVTTTTAKMLMAAADVASTKITPRDELKDADFSDIWWVGDYSATGGKGYVAIKMLNSLNTAGFSVQTTDKDKGQFAFEFTGHYSVAAQDTVPYEVYIGSGTNGNG